MKIKIIVTGVNGFVGQHLARELHYSGIDIIGVGREQSPSAELLPIIQDYVVCEMDKPYEMGKLLNPLMGASAVINLAGIARTNNTPEQNQFIIDTNVAIHQNLYEAMLKSGSGARVVSVCTGLAYDLSQGMPLTESSALLPDADGTNAYVRSKIQDEQLAELYRKKGLEIVTVRPFNHSGFGQGEGFFIPDQINKIRKAQTEGVHLELDEYMDFWRDFLHVKDVVVAYRLLAALPSEKLQSNLYNVASGVPVYGADIYRKIANALNFTNYTLGLKSNESKQPRIAGCHDLITSHTGWMAVRTLDDIVNDQV